VRLWPLRDFADDTYRRVDDRPFGGGPGMVMLAEPLERALAAAQAPTAAMPGAGRSTSPRPGAPRPGPGAARSPAGPGAVLLCGRYEGIDQRFIDRHVTRELSLGDFVLSGGELPALALLDAVARLQPGVLMRRRTSRTASPTACWKARTTAARRSCLPGGRRTAGAAVLLSGHHAEIARWRREQSLRLTDGRRRPDLIAAARAAGLSDRRRSARHLRRARLAIIAGFSILCRAPSKPLSLRGPSRKTPARSPSEKPMDLIATLEQEEIARLNKTIPPSPPATR
jgi:tRNA (guanine37-N1)-methyltransferase